MNSAPLTVVYVAIDQLKPFPHNARTHSPHQIRQIAESIGLFGFTNPVLVDRTGQILAGHGRVKAAKLRGMKEVPAICLEDLTEEQLRAYVLADNKLAESAGWDKEILAIELQNLLTLDSADFDVTITGFEIPEIDLILEEAKGNAEREENFPEPDPDANAITEPGDLWQLGKHRILCGNSLDTADYSAILGPRKAAMSFTDPPYNVEIDGNATGKGAIHHREFAMASGDMSDLEFISFLDRSLHHLAAFSAESSVHFVCMDWRHISDLIAAGRRNFKEFLNICVWIKDNGGMGSFYRSQHEFVAVFRKGKGPHRNNIQLGKFGRNRTNVWEYPGVQTQSKQGGEGNLLALHPTVKPVAMVADAILDCTARGEIVLDPFLGSGTTLMAAERVGRVCYGIEIDPLYVDVAIRRWQAYAGEPAIHARSRRPFDETAKAKGGIKVG